MKVLALVPARGGSKGIPRKNLVEVGGRTLLDWSVRSALAAECVDRVIVSTEDREIAQAARAAGAEVPFERPQHLASDTATDLPVFQHALEWLATEERYRPDLVVHLRPTSPARRADSIDRAVAHLVADPRASSLRSVSPAPVTPWKMWSIVDGYLDPVLGTMEAEAFNQPRQQLPEAWLHDGVIDVIRSSTIEAGSMTGPRILAWRSSPEEAVDIDDPRDLGRAEEALRSLAAAPRHQSTSGGTTGPPSPTSSQ